MREIRTLRAMWRALETEPRQFLTGHEEGNLGYKPRRSLRAAAPVLDPTGHSSSFGCPVTTLVVPASIGLIHAHKLAALGTPEGRFFHTSVSGWQAP